MAEDAKMLEDMYLEACKSESLPAPRPEVISAARGRRAGSASGGDLASIPALSLNGSHHSRFRNRINDGDISAIISTILPRDDAVVAILLGADFSCNRISDVGGLKLATAVASGALRSHLHLRANDITHKSVEALADALTSPSCDLRSLDLSGCNVGKEGAVALANAIRKGTPLESLLLNGAELETTGLIDLLSSIRDLSVEAAGASMAGEDLPSVSSVPSSSSSPSEPAAAAEEAASSELPASSGHATSGSGTGTGTGSGTGRAGGGALRLRRLELDNPRLFATTEDTTYHCARAVSRNSSLQCLSLEKQPHASSTGAEVLAAALEEHPGLRELRLGCNRLGPDGVGALARLSVANPLIRSYKLDCTHGCDQGAAAWADVLVAGSGAERLDLRSCGMRDGGVCGILESIARAATEETVARGWRLRRVLLWGNEFGPRSCKMAVSLFEAGALVPVGDAGSGGAGAGARVSGAGGADGKGPVGGSSMGNGGGALVRVEVDVRPFVADDRAQVAHCA